MPFGTMLAIVVLWFGISAPLSAIGAYYGSKHGVCLDEVFLRRPMLMYIAGCTESRPREPDPAPDSPDAALLASLGRPSLVASFHQCVDIPAQAAALLSGILPFGAAFVEMYFVMSSLFASRAYYAFGFLALTAGVVALTTATVTILFTYFILCAEEYRYVLIAEEKAVS